MTLYTEFLAKYGPDELYRPTEEEMEEIRKAQEIEFEEREKEEQKRMFYNTLLNCVIKCPICGVEVFVPKDGSVLFYGTYDCKCPNGHSLNGEPWMAVTFCYGCKCFVQGYEDPCECSKYSNMTYLKTFPFKNGCKGIEWISDQIEKEYTEAARELEKYGKR